MDVLRARAAALVRQRVLSGLPRLRISLPNASQVLRYDRGAGLHLGAGASWIASTNTRIESAFGYAFGAEVPGLSLAIRRQIGETTTTRLRTYLNEVRDIGIRPGAPGAFNTLSALGGDDFLDPFRASGIALEITHELSPSWRLSASAQVEEHEAARLVREEAPIGGNSFRAVRPAEEGTMADARVSLEFPLRERSGWSWGTRIGLAAGAFEGDLFVTPRVDAMGRRGSASRAGQVDLRLAAGLTAGDPPAQEIALGGGRNTVPGYEYRSYAGDAFLLLDAEASRDVFAPWIRARVLAAGGWIGDAGTTSEDAAGETTAERVRRDWGVQRTDGFITSIGAGVGLGWDVLRIDLVRGLSRGGEWQLLLSIQPRLWGVL
jgi:hypothetical protein